MFLRLWTDDRGATAIEYCFIAALVSVAVVVGSASIGNKLIGIFQRAAGGLS